MPFKFELGEKVRLKLGKEEGVVCGRTEYSDEPNRYYMTAEAHRCRAFRDWKLEEDLETTRGFIKRKLGIL